WKRAASSTRRIARFSGPWSADMASGLGPATARHLELAEADQTQPTKADAEANAEPSPAKAWAVCRGRACAQARSAAAPARARSARQLHTRRVCPSGARVSARSELRGASRRCEHRRAPPRSGGCALARPRHAAHSFARTDLSHANAPHVNAPHVHRRNA